MLFLLPAGSLAEVPPLSGFQSKPAVIRAGPAGGAWFAVTAALLAKPLTLTPASVTSDVASDRSFLYAHSMFVDDPDAVGADFKNGFERRRRERTPWY